MEIWVNIILGLVVLAFIVYPFFKSPGISAAPAVTKQSTGESTEIDDEIEKQVRKMRQHKGVFCSRCGRTNPSGSRFCAQCGTNLIQRKKNG